MMSQDLAALLNDVQNAKDDMLDLTIRWAQISSGSFNTPGLLEMQAALKQAFAPLCDTCESLPSEPVTELNAQGLFTTHLSPDSLLFTKRKNAPYQILLMGHMDTVFQADHPFKTVTRLSPQLLQGPGVADLKGGLVVLLHALKFFETLPEASEIGWQVLINTDEEIGSKGSSEWIKKIASRHNVGLVFEPSLPDGGLVSQRKGVGHLTVFVKGKAAHAGRNPKDGRSAILSLSEFILKAQSLESQYPGLSLTVGKIEGGESSNSVPEKALCQIDVRVEDSTAFDSLKKDLESLAQTLSQKNEVLMTLDGLLHRPHKPFSSPVKKLFSVFENLAQTLDIKLTTHKSGGGCDGNNLLAAGLVNLDTLGVVGNHIHTSQEVMEIDSLVTRTQLSLLFLQKMALLKTTFK